MALETHPRDAKLLSRKQLESMGSVRGLASPCCYRHSGKDLSFVVRKNDFVLDGVETYSELELRQMEKSFLVKVIGRFGSDKKDVHELRIGSSLAKGRGPSSSRQTRVTKRF